MHAIHLHDIAFTQEGPTPIREFIFRLNARLEKEREEQTPIDVGNTTWKEALEK